MGILDRPVWIGCRLGSAADVPPVALAAPPATPPILLQSITQDKVILSNVGEGITLETVAGQAGPSIKVTPVGVIISDGTGATISLTGGVVTVNQGALIVK